MHRVGDIFDVWFDSAVASWATLGFPAETADFGKLWPADFITEGQDQTRGWFYSQLGASTIAFGKAPYKSVCMHGFALDAEGKKMSKSLGNVVTPEEVIAKVGVDVLRLYVLSSSAPWDDLKFNWDGVATVNRATNILWNVYRFPIPYMILDRFEPQSQDGVWNGAFVAAHLRQLPDKDRWIISRINTVPVSWMRRQRSASSTGRPGSCVTFILEDLSRWYVQLVRPRMWLEGESQEKRFAYETIYYVMRRLIGLMAPFCPHITEEIYGNIRCRNDPASVHMLDWQACDDALTNAELEHAMELVRSFDDAVQNARQAGKRKLRWPVEEVVIVTAKEDVKGAVVRLNEVCKDRANARRVTVVMGRWDRIGWHAEPVMKALGKGFGRDSFKVKGLIEAADGNAIKMAVDAGQTFTLTSGSAAFEIGAEHVTFTEKLPVGIFSAPMEDATVYVDVALTPELEAEGYAREVIRRIQEMRRQLDLAVEDFILADVAIADERICGLVSTGWKAGIADEVRAKELSLRRDGEGRAPVHQTRKGLGCRGHCDDDRHLESGVRPAEFLFLGGAQDLKCIHSSGGGKRIGSGCFPSYLVFSHLQTQTRLVKLPEFSLRESPRAQKNSGRSRRKPENYPDFPTPPTEHVNCHQFPHDRSNRYGCAAKLAARITVPERQSNLCPTADQLLQKRLPFRRRKKREIAIRCNHAPCHCHVLFCDRVVAFFFDLLFADKHPPALPGRRLCEIDTPLVHHLVKLLRLHPLEPSCRVGPVHSFRDQRLLAVGVQVVAPRLVLPPVMYSIADSGVA